MTGAFDVVILGGGHNALTAASYIANAGKSVLVLERLDTVGGAAVSAETFAGIDARLSRYSYLVSLLPSRIRRDLALDLRLQRRRVSSYTPVPGEGLGLLVDSVDQTATRASFESIGAVADASAWNAFYSGVGRFAQRIFPTMTEPLLRRSEARALVGDDTLWSSLVATPIGTTIERTFANDLVRGVVLSDALIGTFAPTIDETLSANRCFLFHVIGNGTGNWDVPIGGMGAVSGALERAARAAGARILTGAVVTSVDPEGAVTYRAGGAEYTVVASTILSGVAPHVLERLIDQTTSSATPEGAQVKVNLLLSRLPRLRDARLDPATAFSGTFHVNENWSQLDSAFSAASRGALPDPLPAEVYCHSLSDPSILSPELRTSGAHTLTVFGLHTPDRLMTGDTPDRMRAALQAAVVTSLDSVLAEPIEPLLLTDANGRPTIETKTTRDVETALNMPGGNIFHGPLSWPFAEDDAPLTTPAQRWGVATEYPRILVCGSGAVRGGAVSGIGGHNAAMAVLEGA